MANEAIIVNKTNEALDFIVADGTGIEKGTLLKLSDARTAAASDGSGDKLAGIAQREKVANTGRTRLAVHYHGVFRMTAGAAIAVGAPVMSSGSANKVITATGVTGCAVLGYALEAAAADAEEIEVFVNIGGAL